MGGLGGGSSSSSAPAACASAGAGATQTGTANPATSTGTQAKVYAMCSLQGTAATSTITQAMIARWTLLWQYGFTNLALNSARAQICTMTTPITPDQATFFTEELTTPMIM